MLPTNPIFLDPAVDASDEVFYLGAYYAPGHPNFKGRSGTKTLSQLILDIKTPKPKDMNNPRRWENMRQAAEYFRRQLDPLLAKGFPIVIVPPSYSGINRSGLPDLARRLAVNDRIDASQCLIRHTDKAPQHEGGSRDLDIHFKTARVEHVELIRGRRVLLLDDVGTSGSSMRAYTQMLLEAGASGVKCAALGETTH